MIALDEVVDGHEVLVGAVAEPQGVQLPSKLGHLLLQTARLQHEPAHRLHVHVQVVDVRQTGGRLPAARTGLHVIFRRGTENGGVHLRGNSGPRLSDRVSGGKRLD